MNMKEYWLIKETIWNLSPKEIDPAGSRVFVKYITEKKATKRYNESGYYQFDEFTEDPQSSEDSYTAEAKSYEKLIITEEEYREYKKIIKKYNAVEDLF